jgi:redox-sensitive bicupin YhaK (pirin superfamily)
MSIETNPGAPTLSKRPADERGTADHGWLKARFTFSFAGYHDPRHMGFRALRVMNNDTIQPGGGFDTHPHDNMEIFTYVLSGQLEHRDSMGNGAVIEPGNLQYMSAGSGVTHSEFNPSADQPTHLYQVWLTPNERNGTPRYAEKPLGDAAEPDRLHLLFSGDGRDGSTAIRQDADISFAALTPGTAVSVPASAARPHAWVQVLEGAVRVHGTELETGDGLALEHASGPIPIEADAATKLLVFRLS